MESRIETELHRANERYIEMLTEIAQHDTDPMYPLVRSIDRQLAELDGPSRLRAGQRPYLLMNFRFNDEQWWRAVVRRNDRLSLESWSSHYSRRAAVELARRALTLAWHRAGLTTRSSIELGLSPKVAALMSEMPLEDLEHIAECHVHLMQPRWGDRPAIWRRLLEAARLGDTQALQCIDLHGAQLLASDLMGQSG